MKNLVIIISSLLLSLSINAQGTYEKGMEQAFKLWGQNKIEESSNLFERIAKAEKENWIPYYYVALLNTTSSFEAKDRNKVPAQLEKAQEFLNLSKTFKQDDVENMVLQALLFTAHLTQDGSKAQDLAPKIEGIYQKALAKNPKNPRVVSSFADWKIGSAKFFKQDTSPYCGALEKGLLLFDSYEQKEKFGPTWGKERVVQQLAECDK